MPGYPELTFYLPVVLRAITSNFADAANMMTFDPGCCTIDHRGEEAMLGWGGGGGGGGG